MVQRWSIAKRDLEYSPQQPSSGCHLAGSPQSGLLEPKAIELRAVYFFSDRDRAERC